MTEASPPAAYSVSAGTCPPWCESEHERGDPTHLRRIVGSAGATVDSPYVAVLLIQGRTERRPAIRLSVVPDPVDESVSARVTAAQARVVALLVNPTLGAAMLEIADLADRHKGWWPSTSG